MMQHPYYRSPKAEQAEVARELYRLEAVRFLEMARSRPSTGRVLEAIDNHH
ncbi:hypothetical protein X748_14125 [Mesorhizobium sp. LNJC386A00]|nr:hypothetical protein X748_14125 [Mesorhizobium sp. LNJC386A00]